MRIRENPQETLEPVRRSADSMAANSRQELRQRAGQRARMLAAMDSENFSLDEARRPIDELCARQIALEMENEGLRRTQVALEAARGRYLRVCPDCLHHCERGGCHFLRRVSVPQPYWASPAAP